MRWKSLSSFLNEAPEDILSVKDKEGKKRKLKQVLTSPKPAAAVDLLARARETANQEPPPIQQMSQDELNDPPRTMPGLRAKKRAVQNPEIASILRGNEFIRNHYYDNENFADLFDQDERFRNHFRDRNNDNTPDSKGETLSQLPKDLLRYNETLRELKSGRKQPRANGGRVFVGYGDERRPVEWHDDYGYGNRRSSLETYDRNNKIDRQYTLDGFALPSDQEKAIRQQTGRQFDFNDPDVFEDYYKSVARILRGIDTNDIGFEDERLIEEHIANLMNGELEANVGDLPVNPDTGNTYASELSDYEKTYAWNERLRKGSKISRFIHQIPDKYDLNDSEIRRIVGTMGRFRNPFELGAPQYKPVNVDNIPYGDDEKMQALESQDDKWRDMVSNYDENKDEVEAELTRRSMALFDEMDLKNPIHLEFIKGMARADRLDPRGAIANPADTLYGIRGNDNAWMNEQQAYTDNSKKHLAHVGFDKSHFNNFIERFLTKDNARSIGRLMSSLDEGGGYSSGSDEDVHPFLENLKEYMETGDVAAIPSIEEWQELGEDNDYVIPEADMLELQGDDDEKDIEGLFKLLQAIGDETFDPGFSFNGVNSEENQNELRNHLAGSMFGYVSRGLRNHLASQAAPYHEALGDEALFGEVLEKGISRMLGGNRAGLSDEEAAFRDYFSDLSDFDDFHDFGEAMANEITNVLGANALENEGSNSYYGEYHEDEDLLPDYNDIFTDENASMFDMRDNFNQQMRDAIEYANEQDYAAAHENEDDDEDDDEQVYDFNHPRNLWGAENPEDAPDPKDQNILDRIRNRALRAIEGGAQGLGGAAYAAVQNMEPERRDKIMRNPRARDLYNRINNLNLRGYSGFGGPNPDEDENSNNRWAGTDHQTFRDDHTSYGLNFNRNPNNYQTHKIQSLDRDLANAGLSRRDLRRSVYIAWSVSRNDAALRQKYKEKTGKDAVVGDKDYERFAKRIIAFNAVKNWKENVLPALNVGDILYNTPIGGKEGERALLYQKMGFGKDTNLGQQAVVGADGKVYPLDPPSEGTMARHRERRQASVGRRRDRAAEIRRQEAERTGQGQAPTPQELLDQAERVANEWSLDEQNQSYFFYEAANRNDMAFFSKEHPDMDEDMIADILSIFSGEDEEEEEEKEKPDPMISMRDNALKKIKKYFDHDD